MASGISKELREYIEAIAEEVVLGGKSLQDHERYLRRFCEAESMDYEALKADLTDFIQCVTEYRKTKSKAGERLAQLLARECFVGSKTLEKLMGGSGSESKGETTPAPSSAVVYVEAQQLMRQGKIGETEKDGQRILCRAAPCRQ